MQNYSKIFTQLRPGCDVGEDPGPQGAPQGFLTGVGGADAHDMRALLQQLQRDLDGEVLIRLDHRACLVEVVDQQPSTGVLLLEQAAVPDQGGKVGAANDKECDKQLLSLYFF